MQDEAPELPLGLDPDCGSSTSESSTNYGQRSSSSRTLKRSRLARISMHSTPSLGVFDPSDTAENERSFPLRTWVQTTSESAGSVLPTPNATAFKGGRLSPRKGVPRPERNNYQDFCSLVLGMRYPLPEFGETVMGFPVGWTLLEIEPSATPSSPRSPKSSDAASSK